MLNAELLKTAVAGMEFDTESAFLPGLSSETVKGTVTEATKDKYILFDLTYMGVFVGKGYCERKGNKLEWGEL